MALNNKLPGRVRTMIVGVFTVVGILVLVSAIFFFKPSLGDNKNKLTVNFANIEGIDVGTRVTYAGRPVGEVVAIAYIPREDENRIDNFGNPYAYQVSLRLDSSIHIYNTDLIEIRTLGLLGEKSIAIIPQYLDSKEKSKSVIGGVIYANSEDPLTSTLKTVQLASEEISKSMSNLSTILKENQALIHSSMQGLNTTLKGVAHIVEGAQQMNILENLNDAILNIGQFTGTANEMMLRAKDMNLIEKVGSTFDNLTFITEQIANGKGTLGKLVNDPSLYLRAISVLDRVNQLVYDLNHFGLLFHRNRAWKEQQKERLEKMELLKSPDAFTQAFEKEMTQINEALDRVTQMVDQAEMGNEEVLDSKEFKKSFFDLLQQVNHLQNLIELYNQKVTGP